MILREELVGTQPKRTEKEEIIRKLSLYTLSMQAFFTACEKVLTPATSVEDKVLLGLLLKLKKLFYALCRNIENNEGTATSILMRPYYETALTLAYLAISQKEVDFKYFQQTSFMRNKYEWQNVLSSKKFNPEEWPRKETAINKLAKEAGYLPEDVPAELTKTGSWHVRKTYKAMATELDSNSAGLSAKNTGWLGEYLAIFSMYSSSIHANWLDLKDFHLKQDPTNMEALLGRQEDDADWFIGYCQTLCFALKACLAVAENRQAMAAKIIEGIDRTHRSLHSMQKPIMEKYYGMHA